MPEDPIDKNAGFFIAVAKHNSAKFDAGTIIGPPIRKCCDDPNIPKPYRLMRPAQEGDAPAQILGSDGPAYFGTIWIEPGTQAHAALNAAEEAGGLDKLLVWTGKDQDLRAIRPERDGSGRAN